MATKKILMIAGGSPELWPEFSAGNFDSCIGIDRGSLYIMQRGWPLAVAVGDFDSLTTEERQQVVAKAETVVPSKAEKDDTDTQLALFYVFEHWPDAEVTLIGATGGRLDHLLSNLWLGLEPRFQNHAGQILIADRQNVLRYYQPGTHQVKKIPGMKYLAYCCLTPVSNLTLIGSKYLLDHVAVPVPTAYGSNEFLPGKETVGFSFDSGMIAVIQSRD